MNEVEPWKHLEGLSTVSIEKIIGWLGAVYGDDQRLMFGTAGGKIALELQAFVDCQGGKKKKKKKKTAAQETEEKDGHKWEVGALTKFSTLCEESLGVKANTDFGRDRKLLRKLGENNSPEFIDTAMWHFFDLKDKGFIFRQGTLKDFFNSFVSLCKEAGISESDVGKTTIPVGV